MLLIRLGIGLALAACSASSHERVKNYDLIGQDSFAIIDSYGAPSSYQLHDDQLQLNYGNAETGCKTIFLIDHTNRVVAWATSGKKCISPAHSPAN